MERAYLGDESARCELRCDRVIEESAQERRFLALVHLRVNGTKGCNSRKGKKHRNQPATILPHSTGKLRRQTILGLDIPKEILRMTQDQQK